MKIPVFLRYRQKALGQRCEPQACESAYVMHNLVSRLMIEYE
uniref:Uncharacterized protein n=1 Tax=Pseudomonas monteilii TaxID=76759 RepID=A0A6B7PW54_9PSED|nr:hypothetical protein [Pseudomonas monteilii]